MKKVLFSFAILTLIVSCNEQSSTADIKKDSVNVSASENKAERNKKVALESVTSVSSGDVERALKNVAPDALDYGDGNMPVIKGVDSIKIGIRELVHAFPDYKGENLIAIADGDYVAIYGDWSGTFKNDVWGMKATNKSFKVKDVDIFKFNDEGKIIEHRSIQPISTMMQQVGAKMKK